MRKDSTCVYDMGQGTCPVDGNGRFSSQKVTPMRNLTRSVAVVLIALATASPAVAAELYPSQRITLIVPFPPGSATDSVTRHLAESIRAATSATVVVENKPGADATLRRSPC